MKLEGLKANFLGDSITEGASASSRDKIYWNVLKSEYGLAEARGYGIGGTRIAKQKNPSAVAVYDQNFCERFDKMDDDADLIVVFGGTNDYGHGDAPFGTLEDTDPMTYCGAVYWLMNFLKTNYPKAQVVFMTPAHRKGDAEKSKNAKKAPDCKPLVEYAKAIEAQGEKLGVPVLNLFEKLPIDPNDIEQREKYTIDGLHFNDDGHALIAEQLIKFLKAL